jgi:hypothetical protein
MDCRVKPGNDEREVVSGRQKQMDRPGHSCPKVGVATLAYDEREIFRAAKNKRPGVSPAVA